MKIEIVIYSNDPETVWNTFRFGNCTLKEGDKITVFLLGKGVESESIRCVHYHGANALLRRLWWLDGCVPELPQDSPMGGSELYPISTLGDLHALVKESDKIVTS
jgi:uncharacterized protein involved in oxidation of intracellular sulfur